MARQTTRPIVIRGALLSVLVLVGLLDTVVPFGAPPAAYAATTTSVSGGAVEIEGHGYGHGRGLSQYGARGAALSGLDARRILDFYYPGTTTATLVPRNIRVLVSADDGLDVLVIPSHGIAVFDEATGVRTALPPGPTQWRIVSQRSGRLQVQANVPGSGWNGFAVGGQSTLAGPVHFTGSEFIRLVLPGGSVRGYRAEVVARPDGPGRLRTVNLLPFEDYLRGVVPRESPSSWPASALQAQAVAARSYSEYKRSRATSTAYDICDTTACQVYQGARTYNSAGTLTGSVETAATDAAVATTARQVRTWHDSVILAEFSSSNGGQTASGSVPYFVSKSDPYEAVGSNPNHTWRVRVPAQTLESAFPSVGTLTAVTIESRDGGGDWGGRVLRVTLVGRDGQGRSTSVATTGAGIRSAAGLKSSYFTVVGAPASAPRGALDEVGPDHSFSGDVTVRGWTIDDGAPRTPTRVHVYVNGKGAASLSANLPRDDVAGAFPVAGAAHGFSTTLALLVGTHEVCAFAIGIGQSGNTLLRCVTVTVLDASPVGRLDSAQPRTTSGALSLSGWAFDPSQSVLPVSIAVSVDGRAVSSSAAAGDRPDVGRAYPSAGSSHGFSIPLSLARGAHQVCVDAINVGAGSNVRLGCTSVNVLSSDAVGNVDSISPRVSSDGAALIRGWAFDPDSPTHALRLHVYVDGAGYGSFGTDVTRPDVAVAHPGVGRAQGFEMPIRLSLGDHEVCVFAISVGPGSSTLLRCAIASVVDRQAIGSVDALTAVSPGVLEVRGWALDLDTLSVATRVHVYVDGRGQGSYLADADRPDVGRVYAGAGARHGFALPLTVPPGQHQVCVFATSTGSLAAPVLMRCLMATA